MNELTTIYLDEERSRISIVVNEYPDFVIDMSLFQLRWIIFTKNIFETESPFTLYLYDSEWYTIKGTKQNILCLDFANDDISLVYDSLNVFIPNDNNTIHLPIEVGYEIYNKLKDMYDNGYLNGGMIHE